MLAREPELSFSFEMISNRSKSCKKSRLIPLERKHELFELMLAGTDQLMIDQ